MKREIDKFPYAAGPDLSEAEARENFRNFYKKYGPLTMRIGFYVLMMSSSGFAQDIPASSPVGNSCAPTPAPVTLPVAKEALGIASVGFVCAAAVAGPLTVLGVTACVVTIAAKSLNKL